ncbi:MAG: cytochrome-c peroxidase [Oligoflexia bacterium]|nr:cytochrome-c peroxidase [Oligoflexia bacterium]
MHKVLILLMFYGVAVSTLAGCDSKGTDQLRNSRAALGEKLFHSPALSNPPGQACASCHDENTAFSSPASILPTAVGAAGVRGRRQVPTLTYAHFAPPLAFNGTEQIFFGGLFWDGRADSLEAQVAGPLLSPLEMNNSSKAEVVSKLAASDLATEFRATLGEDIFDDVDRAFDALAGSIAEYQRTEEFAPFTSKYDYYLSGAVELTAQELRGLALFNSPNKGNCAACHPSTGSSGAPPLFTDFTFDNLGVPKNPSNPFYKQGLDINPEGANFIDLGLAATTERAEDRGKQKVMTLRNIAKTAPYFHNGVFNDLETVVRFYNSRDLGSFSPPEVPENVNHDELGNLGLSSAEISDLVAFLHTLSDGFGPTNQ